MVAVQLCREHTDHHAAGARGPRFPRSRRTGFSAFQRVAEARCAFAPPLLSRRGALGAEAAGQPPLVPDGAWLARSAPAAVSPQCTGLEAGFVDFFLSLFSLGVSNELGDLLAASRSLTRAPWNTGMMFFMGTAASALGLMA